MPRARTTRVIARYKQGNYRKMVRKCPIGVIVTNLSNGRRIHNIAKFYCAQLRYEHAKCLTPSWVVLLERIRK
jgi:hypothetical protein